MRKKSKKAYQILLLFSGGLDSIIAARMLKELKFKITALIFKSCFLDSKQAIKTAKKYGLQTIIRDFSQKQLAVVKNPKFGYGKNINPCLDCRILMLAIAKKIANKKKKMIIVSGEVLGQRPMSQNRQSLQLIEKESNLENKILRPLSGKILPPTLYEKEGVIKRSKFYGISGKSRQPQFKLLKKLHVSEYPTPSGGCLLTDPEFSHRLKNLLQKVPECKVQDVLLLKRGRIFWDKKNLIAVGRNKEENKLLAESYRKKTDIFLEPLECPGPSILMRNFSKEKIEKKQLEKMGEILKHYSSKANKNKVFKIKLRQLTGTSELAI
jgi:tRNA-uridine 2-sulfurtransferase